MEKYNNNYLYIYLNKSNRSTNIVSAGLSLGRTVFVCIVLTCGALTFSKDGTIHYIKIYNTKKGFLIYFKLIY